MLTEECDMRPYLERRGIEIIETDLGERIQQLDDEPPSHIVVPAVHKLRDDVADGRRSDRVIAPDVRLWPKAAAPAGDCRVRFRGYSCRDAGRVAWQLMTQTGSRAPNFAVPHKDRRSQLQ